MQHHIGGVNLFAIKRSQSQYQANLHTQQYRDINQRNWLNSSGKTEESCIPDYSLRRGAAIGRQFMSNDQRSFRTRFNHRWDKFLSNIFPCLARYWYDAHYSKQYSNLSSKLIRTFPAFQRIDLIDSNDDRLIKVLDTLEKFAVYRLHAPCGIQEKDNHTGLIQAAFYFISYTRIFYPSYQKCKGQNRGCPSRTCCLLARNRRELLPFDLIKKFYLYGCPTITPCYSGHQHSLQPQLTVFIKPAPSSR